MAQEKNLTAAETKVEARAYPIAEPKSNTLAFASVNIDDKFAINGIRVVSGENGLFVAMPQTRDNKGDYRDVCFPVTAELRKQIGDTVLSEYAAALDTMVEKRESTIAQMRETARSIKERPPAVKDKAPGKATGAEL
jgi:stage V sporulation protein G